MRSLGIRDSPGRRRSPAFSKARARTCPLSRTLTSHPLAPSRGKGPGADKRRAKGRRARARPPDPRSPGHPRPPNPLPVPEVSLSPSPLSTAWSPVAERGPRGPRGAEHPPRSMAATLAAARVAPPPPGREGGASVTAQWAAPGGGTRAAPRSPSSVSARALRGRQHTSAAPRARAVPPKRPRRRDRQPHSSPYQLN